VVFTELSLPALAEPSFHTGFDLWRQLVAEPPVQIPHCADLVSYEVGEVDMVDSVAELVEHGHGTPNVFGNSRWDALADICMIGLGAVPSMRVSDKAAQRRDRGARITVRPYQAGVGIDGQKCRQPERV